MSVAPSRRTATLNAPPASHGPPGATAVVIVTAIFAILTTITSVLRVGRRLLQQKRIPRTSATHFPQADDHLFVISLFAIWACAGSVLVFATTSTTTTRDDDDNDEDDRVKARAAAAVDFTWAFATASVRLAVALGARRLFVWPWVPRIVHAFVGLSVALLVATVVAVSLQCGNVAAWWTSTEDGARCSNVHAIQYGTGAVGVVLSAATFTLSPVIIRHLRMRNAGRNLWMSFLYLLGWSSVAAGIARVASVSQNTDANHFHSNAYVLFSFLEPSLGLLTGCIPTIRKFFYFRRRSTTDALKAKASQASFLERQRAQRETTSRDPYDSQDLELDTSPAGTTPSARESDDNHIDVDMASDARAVPTDHTTR